MDISTIPTWEAVGLDAGKGTPERIGQTYFATDTKIGYIATGISSSSDWKAIYRLPTTKGTLLVADANGQWGLLSAGTDGQGLVYDSSEALGLKAGAVGGGGVGDYAKVEGYAVTPVVGSSGAQAHQWNSEIFDTNGMVDLGTDDTVVTIQTAGVYEVYTYVTLVEQSGNFTDLIVYNRLNATGFGRTWRPYIASVIYYPPTILLYDLITCAVNDEIDLYLDNTTGSTNSPSTAGVAQADWAMIVKQVG